MGGRPRSVLSFRSETRSPRDWPIGRPERVYTRSLGFTFASALIGSMVTRRAELFGGSSRSLQLREEEAGEESKQAFVHQGAAPSLSESFIPPW